MVDDSMVNSMGQCPDSNIGAIPRQSPSECQNQSETGKNIECGFGFGVRRGGLLEILKPMPNPPHQRQKDA
jgi:hypothetical protein